MRLSHVWHCFAVVVVSHLMLSACSSGGAAVNKQPPTGQVTAPDPPAGDSQTGADPQPGEGGGDSETPPPPPEQGVEEPPPPPAEAPAPPAALPGTADTIVPDDEAIRRAEAAASPEDLRFTTAEVIDALSYGLVGDGRTDNTAVFQRLLTPGNRTIHVPPGDYVTSRLEFSANTVLMLAPGVIIRDAGLLEPQHRLLNIRTENVWISGQGARVIADRGDYTTGEQRHGVYIFGARRVLIEGLESSGQGGDGFYIGGPSGSPSTDIMLSGCSANNNRRQGLSVTSARRVRIVDSEFMSTNGTAPQFGIDLEPNSTLDVMDQITILRPQTRGNAGGGIFVNLHRVSETSEPVDITIIDHRSEAETPHLQTYVAPGARTVLRYSGERPAE